MQQRLMLIGIPGGLAMVFCWLWIYLMAMNKGMPLVFLILFVVCTVLTIFAVAKVQATDSHH